MKPPPAFQGSLFLRFFSPKALTYLITVGLTDIGQGKRVMPRNGCTLFVIYGLELLIGWHWCFMMHVSGVFSGEEKFGSSLSAIRTIRSRGSLKPGR